MSRRAHLRSLLEAHVPADPREAGFASRMTALLAAEGDPFHRGHFTPGHFTASAFVLSPERDALLLVLHGKLHRWLQPGGHVDPEDVDVLAAARREIAEEVGLAHVEEAGLLDVDIHEIPAMKGDPAHLHLDLRFLFVAPDRSFLAGSDAKAARWVPLAELVPGGPVDTDESVMRAVRKLIAR